MGIYDVGLIPNLFVVQSGYGIGTPFGLVLPPGGRVAAYVSSDGGAAWDEPIISANCVTTLNAGLARVRANKGDTVIVMPGHAENVDSATFLSNLVAGTRIVGLGQGSKMPTFTWTAAAGQFVLSAADVCLTGLALNFAGIDNVTQAVLVTGATNIISGCKVTVSATSKVPALGIDVSTGANGALIENNEFIGITDELKPSGAAVKVSAAVSNVRIRNNVFMCPVRTTGTQRGHIWVSAATLNLLIQNNYFYITNTATATFSVVLDNVASSGLITGNIFAVPADGGTAASAKGISFGGATLVQSGINYCSDEVQKSGMVCPAAAT